MSSGVNPEVSEFPPAQKSLENVGASSLNFPLPNSGRIADSRICQGGYSIHN